MNRIFTEKCGQIVPLFKQENNIVAMLNGGTCIMHNMATQVLPEEQVVIPCMEVIRESVRKLSNEKKCRFILASDDEKAAMKGAMLLSRMWNSDRSLRTDGEYDEDDWEDDWEESIEYEDEWDEEDSAGETLESSYAIIDAREFMDDGNTDFASFLQTEQYWNGNGNCPAVLFLGFEGVTNKKKYINAVKCCVKGKTFLHIPKKLVSDVDVQRLVYEDGFVLLELPENDEAYYEALLQTLLLNNPYNMFERFDASAFLKKCRQKWQKEFSEDRLAAILDYAAENARMDGRNEIWESDFIPLLYLKEKGAYEELMGKIGMESLKEICKKFIALEKEKIRNPKADTARKHMLFCGNPGTGKTTGAAMLAKIMLENGIGNGKFVIATRKDLIGSYVGHTAPRVAAKFDEARGGILFVDEAGFFNQENTGGFVKEALKEFIRYMEIYSDVTVIFAMYPKEERQFLKLDEGITSRITHIVKFDDYDFSQLADITKEMLEGRGYQMPKGYEGMLKEYFQKLKLDKKEAFGNAREARKLVDEMVLEISLRNWQKKTGQPDRLSAKELKEILDRTYEENGNAKEKFGFQTVKPVLQNAVM